jgi:hypothetical protein
MPRPVTADNVSARMHDYASGNYLFVGNVIKGIALTTAAALLLDIIAELPSSWIILLPWITSMTAALVTHMTWSRGMILTNSRANLLDVVFPILAGMFEFLLFAIFIPNNGLAILALQRSQSNLWLNWFGCLAAQMFLGGLIAHNRLQQSKENVDFQGLDDLAKKYRLWMKNDRLGALTLSTCALLAWTVTRYVLCRYGLARAGKIQAAASVLFTIVLVIVLIGADSQRQEIDDYVTQIDRSDSGSLTPT